MTMRENYKEKVSHLRSFARNLKIDLLTEIEYELKDCPDTEDNKYGDYKIGLNEINNLVYSEDGV